uniref:Uncharacterized protein n=1 Tax=Arundo donax TaxID=35708 RepID=A0A0A9EWU1_ARUDO
MFIVRHLQWLHGVEMEADEEVSKVEHHDAGDEPVVVVDPTPVDVVLEPLPAAARGTLHRRDEHRAHVVPDGAGEPEQRGGGAAHALGRLVVQELHVPHRREGVADAVDGKLRHQPEHADRDDSSRVVQEAVFGCGAAALGLDERGRADAEDGDGQPDAHALEVGDPGLQARDAARKGHEGAVVERQGYEHGRGREDG